MRPLHPVADVASKSSANAVVVQWYDRVLQHHLRRVRELQLEIDAMNLLSTAQSELRLP